MEGTRHGRYENCLNVSVWIAHSCCKSMGDGTELYVHGDLFRLQRNDMFMGSKRHLNWDNVLY